MQYCLLATGVAQSVKVLACRSEVVLGCGALPIYPPYCDQPPAPWWDTDADRSLLVGTYKHGYECYPAMRNDPALGFLARCGPDVGSAMLMLANNTETVNEEDVGKITEDEETLEGDNSMGLKDSMRESMPADMLAEPPSVPTPDQTESASSSAEQQLSGVREDDKFPMEEDPTKKAPWPSMVDLNTRLRRVITSYQRNFKKEEMKLAQKAKCAVSSTQKFLVQQHITTSKHQANKQLNSKQRQLFLTQPTTSNVRSEFNIDLCRSLISADIPLYKLKNKVFREFLEKYTQHTIPDESTLRKTYAPSIYDETIQKIRDEIKDSSIWVSIDETPDKEGRLVGNVVIGLLSEQYSERILLHCDVLEKCNNKTIVKLFNEAMGILWPKGIMYDNVLFFISDAALIWSKLDKHYLLYILN
ncbi:hypothetical protein ANN_20025 [Periplaneta americana]|uniref:DUF659 domain-containing protein n=1 Tax=Periplaneta americana TaxID=6978 RepID=A0ABQ8SBI5_PERAM|nr:hypothetical protein ANN_20025 [Periplaneta americana]